MIHEKKMRQIRGMGREQAWQCAKEYLLSGAFIYSLVFAIVHFLFDEDKNGLFIRTFGLVLIDAAATGIYDVLSICQNMRESVNAHLKNKKKPECFKTPLLEPNIGKNGAVCGFKIILFLAVSVLYGTYLYLYKWITGTDIFMTGESAFGYVMFFISVAYFDVFWEGEFKRIFTDWGKLKELTKEDSFLQKYGFYLFLLLVAGYQVYSFLGDLWYGISMLIQEGLG